MARFYGTVQGGRGQASRLGHGTTGLTVKAMSHSGDLVVELFDADGEDHCEIRVRRHHSMANGHLLYRGPIAALLDVDVPLLERMMFEHAEKLLTGEHHLAEAAE